MNKYRKMRFDVGFDAELNKRLQLKLFKAGYAWAGVDQEFNNCGPYIYTDTDGSIYWGYVQQEFENAIEYEHVEPHFYIGTTASETEYLIEIL